MDDARGHAKRCAIRNGNVMKEICSPRIMVTHRHAGSYLDLARQGIKTLGRNERSSVEHGLHINRGLPTGIHPVRTGYLEPHLLTFNLDAGQEHMDTLLAP